ncbi:methionine gamma-lyase-like [Forsythia ovata]|uniref:Methionine gamma-lyase-like n=1 Tax=Forsythia ovata TaxID=205694 RepID=A0ABD1WGS1_9LAMI
METEERANRLMNLLQNCTQFGFMAVSLGYYETLMSCSGSSTSSEMNAEEKALAGISPGLVRMSIGYNGTLEQKWSQLEKALSRLNDSGLFQKMGRNNLVLELDSMNKLAEKCNIQMPMENPDEFTRDVLSGCIAKNRPLKAKRTHSRVCVDIFSRSFNRLFLMNLKLIGRYVKLLQHVAGNACYV